MNNSKKPEDLGFKITDKKFINKNGTLKKKLIVYDLEPALKIRYSYRKFVNEYSKTGKIDHQLYVGFMRGSDTICSIASYIPGDTGLLEIRYSYGFLICKKDKFLEKIESEPKILEWCVWNVL